MTDHLCNTFWNKEQESLMLFWAERAKFLCEMHAEAGNYYEKWNGRLGAPAIVLSAASGVGTLIAGSSWAIIMAFSALGGSACASLDKFWNYGAKAEKHRAISQVYENLRFRIDAEMVRPAALRKEAIECIEEYTEAFTVASSGSPQVPQHIRDKWHKAIDDAEKAKARQGSRTPEDVTLHRAIESSKQIEIRPRRSSTVMKPIIPPIITPDQMEAGRISPASSSSSSSSSDSDVHSPPAALLEDIRSGRTPSQTKRELKLQATFEHQLELRRMRDDEQTAMRRRMAETYALNRSNSDG